MRIVEDIALIENRLLCDAIWGETECKKEYPKFRGYVNASTDLVGKAFIEYCVAQVYGIFRLPQCGYDNYLDRFFYYGELDQQEVLDACSELKEVRDHVQRMIKKSKRCVDNKVSLVRCLSHYQVEEVVEQLKDTSVEEIEVPVSILSSYSYDGNVNQPYPTGSINGKHINIIEDVSIENIVLWDRYVGNARNNNCSYFVRSMYDCEKEVWVVDRSINGKRVLGRNHFHYCAGLPEKFGRFKIYQKKYGRDESLYYNALEKRPCQFDDFLTRTVIKRNVNRLKERDDDLY